MDAVKSQNDKTALENKQMKLDASKAEAIKKYPNAAPFAANITGDKPEDIEARAKEFHDKALNIQQTAVTQKEDEIKKHWGAIPPGSIPNVFQQSDYETEYAKADAMPVTNRKQLVDKIKTKMGLKLIKLGHNMNQRTAGQI